MAFKKEEDFIKAGRGETSVIEKKEKEEKRAKRSLYVTFVDDEVEIFRQLCEMSRMKGAQYIRYRLFRNNPDLDELKKNS